MTSREAFRMQYVPVLLASDRQARRLARSLFWRFGVPTHVFDSRFSFLCRHTPWVVCHILPHDACSDVITLALLEFAREGQSDDHILLLFAPDQAWSAMTPKQRCLLETTYILRKIGDELPIPVLFSQNKGYQAL